MTVGNQFRISNTMKMIAALLLFSASLYADTIYVSNPIAFEVEGQMVTLPAGAHQFSSVDDATMCYLITWNGTIFPVHTSETRFLSQAFRDQRAQASFSEAYQSIIAAGQVPTGARIERIFSTLMSEHRAAYEEDRRYDELEARINHLKARLNFEKNLR